MTADLLVRGASIWTGDPARPRASSVAIAGGRVVALDEERDAATVIDGEGRSVIPGLVDAHLHLLEGGRALGELDLSGVRSRREFEQAVARRHDELEAGAWLIAGGWSSENWPGAETPHKGWLAAAGDRPVVCRRTDLHASLVNDAVLSMCETASDPPGGRVERDPATGEPTGLFVEQAAWKLVNPLIPPREAAAKRADLAAACARLLALGVTSVGTFEYARDLEQVYAAQRGQLPLRVRVFLLDRQLPLDIDAARRFPGDERLAVAGFKSFADGTLGSRTARMLEDYADDPGNRGMLVELAAEGRLGEWARTVAGAGLIPAVHAIGDEAARIALDALAGLGGARARIEHAQTIHPDDLSRFGGAGLIASMQPLHKADDGRYLERRLGAGRMGEAFPFRSLLGAGARLAFGSDWPVVSPDPMAGIRAAVTGLTLDGEPCLTRESLTVAEALRAYTAGAAAALDLDAGVLRPGSLGDLAMLDRDPFAASWAEQPPRVLATVVGGRVAYDER